jgi:trehalose 6-phosphate synthase
VESHAKALNHKYQTAGWRPIILMQEHQDQDTLIAFYRMADVCLVTSLSDGMNLVAKEFVSARSDELGTLILSQFTGASRELTHAVQINPYAVDGMAEAMRKALHTSPEESKSRMRKMREAVREHNVYRWAGKLLEQAARLEPS